MGKIIICGQQHSDPLPFIMEQQFVKKLLDNGVPVMVASEVADYGTNTIERIVKGRTESANLLEDVERLRLHRGLDNSFLDTLSKSKSSVMQGYYKQYKDVGVLNANGLNRIFSDYQKIKYDCNAHKEEAELMSFVQKNKVPVIPLEDLNEKRKMNREHDIIKRESKSQIEYSQRFGTLMREHEGSRIGHMVDQIVKAYKSNPDAIIVVSNLGQNHLKRLSANLDTVVKSI